MKKCLFIGFLVLIVLISGCTSAPDRSTPQPTNTQPMQTTQPVNTPPQHTTPPPAQTIEVKIIDFSFYPSEVTISKGGTVTWTQKDGEPHTVTGSNFNSGKLTQDQVFKYTFNEAGTFDYWCTIHSSMRGKVIVK